MRPHAFTPHKDGRFGCSLCPLSRHHEIHSGGSTDRPPEDASGLFYGTGRVASIPPHIGRRGSDGGQVPRRRRAA